MQNNYDETLSIDRTELACISNTMTEQEAWEKFESGLQNATDYDEAVRWVKKNKAIIERITLRVVIDNFNAEISNANKNWRN